MFGNKDKRAAASDGREAAGAAFRAEVERLEALPMAQLAAEVMVKGFGPAGRALSDLEKLRGWCRDALHVGAEINEQGDALFDTGDRAETVFVVGELVVYRKAFGGRLGIGRFERAGCQAALAPG